MFKEERLKTGYFYLGAMREAGLFMLSPPMGGAWRTPSHFGQRLNNQEEPSL
ncbi:hypothetical protein SAMN05216315_1131 [Nitrosospira sp. Nsp18]|nr:hypothetical protein SAMN05216315_1131 [Nitrosospira sp. Nsp18]